MLANFARRALGAPLRFGVRNASGHHAPAPVKHVDLNIPLEGVESRWAGLVQEQKDVVVKQAQELMKQDWKKLSANQKKTCKRDLPLFYLFFEDKPVEHPSPLFL